MSKDISSFNGFPTDNSSSTNLKYDIVTTKFASGIENYNRRKVSTFSFSETLGLIGVILQLFIAIVVIFGLGIKWVCRRF